MRPYRQRFNNAQVCDLLRQATQYQASFRLVPDPDPLPAPMSGLLGFVDAEPRLTDCWLLQIDIEDTSIGPWQFDGQWVTQISQLLDNSLGLGARVRVTYRCGAMYYSLARFDQCRIGEALLPPKGSEMNFDDYDLAARFIEELKICFAKLGIDLNASQRAEFDRQVRRIIAQLPPQRGEVITADYFKLYALKTSANQRPVSVTPPQSSDIR